jgi:hypothetical protein
VRYPRRAAGGLRDGPGAAPRRRLLLAGHVEASPWYARAAQRLIELVTVPLGGEHLRRRPLTHVRALGYAIERHHRFKCGIVERLAAGRPHAGR